MAGIGGSACRACPAGTASNVGGSSQCNQCAAGSYASGTGNSACATCGVGTYSLTAQAVCTECAAGSYNGRVGSTACTQCAAGTYAASMGASSCATCASGSVSTSEGATSCVACVPGKYAASTSSCVSCPAGRYEPRAGQSGGCIATPNGFFLLLIVAHPKLQLAKQAILAVEWVLLPALRVPLEHTMGMGCVEAALPALMLEPQAQLPADVVQPANMLLELAAQCALRAQQVSFNQLQGVPRAPTCPQESSLVRALRHPLAAQSATLLPCKELLLVFLVEVGFIPGGRDRTPAVTVLQDTCPLSELRFAHHVARGVIPI
jgi:hypothetical protein